MLKADNIPPSCAVVTKSGNLNFLEPFGPVQACNGRASSLSFTRKTSSLATSTTGTVYAATDTYYSASSLNMFRVSTTPIIRSKQNCNYSLRYWSYFFCSYLHPSWPSYLGHFKFTLHVSGVKQTRHQGYTKL